MSFVDSLLQRLFPPKESEQSSYRAPLISEKLERDAEYIMQYEAFKDSNVALLADLDRAFNQAKADLEPEFPFFIHQESSSNGFYFHTNRFAEPAGSFLIDHFRDRMLQWGYRLYQSDRKTREKLEVVETTERHYLKPPIVMNESSVLDQAFGNITIEHVLRDESSAYVKVMATTYAGFNYSEPLPFEEMRTHLFAR